MSQPPSESQTGGLAAAPPPPSSELPPALLESYVRAAMHSDRTPGTLVAIRHPLRMYKVPRGLLEAVEAAGWTVRTVDTQPERTASITAIRDALLAARADGRPLDLLVFSGDGSLDHHVLVAAFWAFHPELVHPREGEIAARAPSAEERLAVPPVYRDAFLTPLPTGEELRPTQETVHRLWVLRSRIAPLLRRERSPARIARRAGLAVDDPLLRLAVYAALLPHRVTLRPDGFDLSGLAQATREHTFQGLYPFVRSIAVYPCGTAADNALYANVPGWTYAQASRILTRFASLDGLRRRWEERARERFVRFFTRQSVVVPARFSVVAFDGDWQVLCSHAAGGPGGGRFFEADLTSKTKGLAGYLARIPQVIWHEGLFDQTVLRLRAWTAGGRVKIATEGRLVEGLYTNRAFIAGVGSVPSTNPTSFAGQSSLVVGPPIVYRDEAGRGRLDLRGLLTFAEAIGKGVLGRAAHLLGLGVGRLAGGGRFALASPEHQITLAEGEVVDLAFLDTQKRPRFVPTQVSGDPFQATSMRVRVAWGPLPLLGSPDSLLLAAAQRSLARLRQQQTWHLDTVFVGGLPCYRHLVGPEWTPSLSEATGLVAPPHHLPRRLDRAQRALVERWERLGTGAFVDTTEQGLALGRRGRYAHNGDGTAHLVLVREPGSRLLARQVRRSAEGDIYEVRARYRAWWDSWILQESQARVWRGGEDPRLLQEEHFFRSEQDFQAEAPSFFPLFGSAPDDPVWGRRERGPGTDDERGW